MTPDDDIAELLNACQTLALATTDESGAPQCSYTPFIWHDQRFYVFVSALAAHTTALSRTGKAGLLVIEDEGKTANPFARKRLSLQATAMPVATGTDQHRSILDAFQARFGETVSVLRQLPDFTLFALAVTQGSFIRGFGQAYRVDAQLKVLSHVGPDQIRAR